MKNIHVKQVHKLIKPACAWGRHKNQKAYKFLGFR